MFIPSKTDAFSNITRGAVLALLITSAVWRDGANGRFLSLQLQTPEGAQAGAKFFINEPGPLPELSPEDRADKQSDAVKAFNRQKRANGDFLDFLRNIGITGADMKDLEGGKAILVLDKNNLSEEEAASIAKATGKPRLISIVGSKTFGIVAAPSDIGGGEKYPGVIRIGDEKLLRADVAAAGSIAQLCASLRIRPSSGGGGRRQAPQEAGDEDEAGSDY